MGRVQFNLSSSSIIKGSIWVYIGGAATNLIGYFYWIVAARLVMPAVVGSASAILAMSGLLIIVLSLGLTTGMRRFLGESYGRRNYCELFQHFFMSLTILAIPNLLVSFVLLLSPALGISAFGLSSYQMMCVGAITLLSFWTPAFVSLFNSILRTKVTAYAQIASAAIKITVGIGILYVSPDLLGIMTAFVVTFLTSNAVFLYWTRRTLSDSEARVEIQPGLWRSHIMAGIPAWGPNILAIAGQSIGFLMIYGLIGALDTGLYFMAFAIASMIYSIPASIQSLMFPIMSGMKEGRERATSRVTRLAMAVTTPIAMGVALYSTLPFTLLGADYLAAASLLTVLVLGAPIYPIYAGFYSYLYAIGKYRSVTLLGLLLNGGRILLYVLLVFSLATYGIALSYTIAVAVALVGVFISARRLGFDMIWGTYFRTLLIPTSLTILLSFLDVGWVIGSTIILFVSFIFYTRSAIISKDDVKEVLLAFMSNKRLAVLHSHLRPIHWMLFGG